MRVKTLITDPKQIEWTDDDGNWWAWAEVPDLPKKLQERIIIDCDGCSDDKWNCQLRPNGKYWCRCLTNDRLFDKKHKKAPKCFH